jgi:hypothetical protein
MTYDPDHQQVVLHGGIAFVAQDMKQSAPLGLTWRHDEGSWTPICNTNLPPARYLPAFAYDPNTRRYVVAGGALAIREPDLDRYESLSQEVWTCDPDTDTWSLSPGQLPAARAGAQMVFDPMRGALVLAGGVDDAGASIGATLASTDGGATWSELTSATFATGGDSTSLTYDDRNAQILAVEQVTRPPRNGGDLIDRLWALPSTGAGWKQVCGPCSGIPRRNAAIVHVTGTWETYLLNGDPGGSSGELDGTWILDQNQWIQASGYIQKRDSVGVVYDPSRDDIVVYGGNGVSCDGINGNCNETWVMSN